MQNIFAEIEYLGTNYFGFQIQDKKHKNEATIQGVVEEALRRLFKQKIRIVYSGRTDRGVHARGQVFNFKVDTKVPLRNIKIAINKILPSDIRIKRVKKVDVDFHARFSAKSKIYRYIILNTKEPSVFWKDFSWHLNLDLDLDKMNKAAKKFTGKKDFSVFAKEANKYKDCRRNLRNISIKKRKNLISIEIEAEGFLRYMVRNIVSFLVKIGSGKINLTDTSAIVSKRSPYTNIPAPSAGLYLHKVKY